MNTLVLIIVAIVAFGLGFVFGMSAKPVGDREFYNQADEAKEENIDKLLELFDRKEKVTNSDVRNLLDVSDPTATRYLEILEERNEITQHGKTGRGTYYTLK